MMTQNNCYKIGGFYSGRAILDYNITPGDKVLDIGGGNHPFKFATHILDSKGEEFEKQRSGEPLALREGQILIEGTTNILPQFKDKEFDYVYCSHILEHVFDLPQCLDEISRIGKRGFVALPYGLFDFFQVVEDHRWFCEYRDNTLVFRRRLEDDSDGLARALWADTLWSKRIENMRLCAYWEGHGCFGLRFLWEIRFMWEDQIDYKWDETIFPQIDVFREQHDIRMVEELWGRGAKLDLLTDQEEEVDVEG